MDKYGPLSDLARKIFGEKIDAYAKDYNLSENDPGYVCLIWAIHVIVDKNAVPAVYHPDRLMGLAIMSALVYDLSILRLKRPDVLVPDIVSEVTRTAAKWLHAHYRYQFLFWKFPTRSYKEHLEAMKCIRQYVHTVQVKMGDIIPQEEIN